VFVPTHRRVNNVILTIERHNYSERVFKDVFRRLKRQIRLTLAQRDDHWNTYIWQRWFSYYTCKKSNLGAVENAVRVMVIFDSIFDNKFDNQLLI
jgi:hypothetical protein